METIVRTFSNKVKDAKDVLWQHLQAHQLEGFGFHRQALIESHEFDFVCFDAKLVVDITSSRRDGVSEEKQQKITFLQNQGYRVLQFSKHAVINKTQVVLEHIAHELARFPIAKPLPEGVWVSY